MIKVACPYLFLEEDQKIRKNYDKSSLSPFILLEEDQKIRKNYDKSSLSPFILMSPFILKDKK